MRRLIRRLVRIETVAVLVIAWLAGALGLGLATGAGAVPTAALMALGLLLGGLLLLIRHSLELASRIGNLASQSTRTLDTARRVEAGLHNEIKNEIKQTFRQLEALQNLSAVLPASDVLPATRGWAASPDLLLVLVDLVITERPSLVVECGSGASTLWLALAMRRFKIDGRIIALDHDPVFGGKTRDFLARHDVRDLAEVRDAPLESFSLNGETYSWYAQAGMGRPDGDRSPLRRRAARDHWSPGPLSGAAVAERLAEPGCHRRPGRPRRAGHAGSTAALARRVPGIRLRDPPAGETGRGAAQELARREPEQACPCGFEHAGFSSEALATAGSARSRRSAARSRTRSGRTARREA